MAGIQLGTMFSVHYLDFCSTMLPSTNGLCISFLIE